MPKTDTHGFAHIKITEDRYYYFFDSDEVINMPCGIPIIAELGDQKFVTNSRDLLENLARRKEPANRIMKKFLRKLPPNSKY